jgi:hypothetical protein
MVTDPRVVAELRAMFREGSTPSRLIQHIAACHGNEDRLFFLIQDYFREAFAVPLVRASNVRAERTQNDLRLAHLNIDLVHEMVQHRSEWDNAPETNGGGRQGWLDSAVATDEGELIERAQPATLPELSGCWGELGEGARNYIKRLIGNVNALYERVQILARLAESLQQRLNERPSPTPAGGA